MYRKSEKKVPVNGHSFQVMWFLSSEVMRMGKFKMMLTLKLTFTSNVALLF